MSLKTKDGKSIRRGCMVAVGCVDWSVPSMLHVIVGSALGCYFRHDSNLSDHKMWPGSIPVLSC